MNFRDIARDNIINKTPKVWKHAINVKLIKNKPILPVIPVKPAFKNIPINIKNIQNMTPNINLYSPTSSTGQSTRDKVISGDGVDTGVSVTIKELLSCVILPARSMTSK